MQYKTFKYNKFFDKAWRCVTEKMICHAFWHTGFVSTEERVSEILQREDKDEDDLPLIDKS